MVSRLYGVIIVIVSLRIHVIFFIPDRHMSLNSRFYISNSLVDDRNRGNTMLCIFVRKGDMGAMTIVILVYWHSMALRNMLLVIILLRLLRAEVHLHLRCGLGREVIVEASHRVGLKPRL